MKNINNPRSEPSFGYALTLAEEKETVFQPTTAQKNSFNRLLKEIEQTDTAYAAQRPWESIVRTLESFIKQLPTSKQRQGNEDASYVFHLHGGKTLAMLYCNIGLQCYVQNEDGNILEFHDRGKQFAPDHLDRPISDATVDGNKINDRKAIQGALQNVSREFRASFFASLETPEDKLKKF